MKLLWTVVYFIIQVVLFMVYDGPLIVYFRGFRSYFLATYQSAPAPLKWPPFQLSTGSVHGTPPPRHPTPYTLHAAPYTLHPTTCNLHPTPCTLHPTPFTLHPTPYNLHHVDPILPETTCKQWGMGCMGAGFRV